MSPDVGSTILTDSTVGTSRSPTMRPPLSDKAPNRRSTGLPMPSVMSPPDNPLAGTLTPSTSLSSGRTTYAKTSFAVPLPVS